MGEITFVSTLHKEIGKCNADQLYSIFERIRPEVFFVEALNDTYTKYEQLLFSSYGLLHEKLEIKAIQKYCLNYDCEYIPVLDNGLPKTFSRKYSIVGENCKLKILNDNYNLLASEKGFDFVNSSESIDLEEEMRCLENEVLNDALIEKQVNIDIDIYEESMLTNINSYCENNRFNSAIFMCGAAHRKSMIEKINRLNTIKNVTWRIFG